MDRYKNKSDEWKQFKRTYGIWSKVSECLKSFFPKRKFLSCTQPVSTNTCLFSEHEHKKQRGPLLCFLFVDFIRGICPPEDCPAYTRSPLPHPQTDFPETNLNYMLRHHHRISRGIIPFCLLVFCSLFHLLLLWCGSGPSFRLLWG